MRYTLICNLLKLNPMTQITHLQSTLQQTTFASTCILQLEVTNMGMKLHIRVSVFVARLQTD